MPHDVRRFLDYLWETWQLDDAQALERFHLRSLDLVVLRSDIPPPALIRHCLDRFPLSREEHATFSFLLWWLHTPPFIQAYVTAMGNRHCEPMPADAWPHAAAATSPAPPDLGAINDAFSDAAAADARDLETMIRAALASPSEEIFP